MTKFSQQLNSPFTFHLHHLLCLFGNVVEVAIESDFHSEMHQNDIFFNFLKIIFRYEILYIKIYVEKKNRKKNIRKKWIWRLIMVRVSWAEDLVYKKTKKGTLITKNSKGKALL